MLGTDQGQDAAVTDTLPRPSRPRASSRALLPTERTRNVMADITDYEAQQIKKTNASKLTPVVFIHGLWLLPSSWDRWRPVFEEAGYATLAPGWPDDPNTVEEANRHPEVFAHKSVGQIADHFGEVIGELKKKPALITYDQFRYAFANAVTEAEAHELYATFAVPGSGVPLFQAATANLNPWTEAKVDTKNPDRGPLLITDGEMDHTVPWAIANASYKQQERNPGVTEIVKIPGRGHSLTIDHGWREVADTALAFIQKHAQP
jgi:non-heme chloroperoxidase